MLELYNTATRSLTTFNPTNKNRVTIYTCGPTVYSTPHLGNFAAYVYWDLLLRTLKLNDYTPYRVLNLTDVGHLASDADSGEDKLEKGAKKEGKTVWEVADYYIARFKSDFTALNLLPPDVWARATDYISESQDLVQRLLDNDFAYETSDGIYYDTSKFPNYASFARLDLQHLKAGARIKFSTEKRNPSDFAVWKFIKPGETHAMRWVFLGRPGYPGWHNECSSIIHSELSPEPIDIHTGGIDHIPVHHTNEIAQTFGAYQKPLARFWLHCNFLTINGEKISKSLGNIITLSDLSAHGFAPADFKLWLYQGHYRSERNFTWSDLAAAATRRKNWLNAVVRLYQTSSPNHASTSPTPSLAAAVRSALNSDLNSAATFAYLDAHLADLSLADWHFLDSVFALNLLPPDRTQELAPLITKRNAARASKDFVTADNIRSDLAKQGITLLDTPTKTLWQII